MQDLFFTNSQNKDIDAEIKEQIGTENKILGAQFKLFGTPSNNNLDYSIE